MNSYEVMMETVRARREEALKASRWGRAARLPRVTAKEYESLSIAELSERVMGG